MADIMKKYKNRSGYTIKATEKAYNLFYKKQGFLPVDESKGRADGEKAAAGDSDKKDSAADDPTGKESAANEAASKEPAKKGKGKGTKAADKAAAEPEAPTESAEEE